MSVSIMREKEPNLGSTWKLVNQISNYKFDLFFIWVDEKNENRPKNKPPLTTKQHGLYHLFFLLPLHTLFMMHKQ